MRGDHRYVDPERLTGDGHLLDDRSEPCPKCGYQRAAMPDWVWYGVVFLLDGEKWIVTSIGSTNIGVRGGHFRDAVVAHLFDATTKTEAEPLGRDFSVEDMRRATFVELLPGEPKRRAA